MKKRSNAGFSHSFSINKNERGEMTIGTIIAIVLGLAVLVFLIFGFSTGWNQLFGWVGNIGGTDSNVDAVVSGCQVACTSQQTNAYCTQRRSLKLGSEHCDGNEGVCFERATGSCAEFSGDSETDNEEVNYVKGQVSIPSCPEISC